MSKGKFRYMLLLAIVAAIISSCGGSKDGKTVIQFGDFQQTVTETGELAAISVKSFMMPRYGRNWYEMKLATIIDHGEKVAPGDTLMQFDPAVIQKYILEAEARLENQYASLEKTVVQIANTKSDLNSQLRSELAAFELKELQMGQIEFESDKSKRMKELEFEQSKIRLNKVKKNIELYETISEKDLMIQKISVQRTVEQIQEAYDVLPKLTIVTPIGGIFQVGYNRRNGETLKVGDEIYYNSKLGNVPDLEWMKVKTYINEADILKVEEGQQVNVRLDALPDVVFLGKVTMVSKLCHPIQWDSRQKVFDVEINLEVSDERLKPGMTVSCEYICKNLSDVWYAPLECVEKVEGEYYVYLKKGTGHIRQKVDVGPANNTNIVLKGEFKKGTELIPIDQVITPKSNV